MTIPPDIEPKIHALLKRTLDGQVNWEPARLFGVNREGDFAVNLGKALITIAKVEYGDNVHVDVKFLNHRGEVALQVTAEPPDAEAYLLMDQLYEAARRRALRADQILKDLSDLLEGGGSIGSKPPQKKASAEDDYPSDDIPF